MITILVTYVVDPANITAFEAFAEAWVRLVTRHGGTHHGYYVATEGAADTALALFSFPSAAHYDRYRARFGVDPEFNAAEALRDDTGCVVRYERTVLRPLVLGTDVPTD
jgi:hypothetical protein